jgi:hypothetical protein
MDQVVVCFRGCFWLDRVVCKASARRLLRQPAARVVLVSALREGDGGRGLYRCGVCTWQRLWDLLQLETAVVHFVCMEEGGDGGEKEGRLCTIDTRVDWKAVAVGLVRGRAADGVRSAADLVCFIKRWDKEGI